jgi:glycosyltransferase involved in cell wall biosynthesis
MPGYNSGVMSDHTRAKPTDVMPAAAPIAISVIAPVYNEEGNIPQLHAELEQALTALGKPYEIIYVNDGSRDGSGDLLAQIAADSPDTVCVIEFRRNFGQTAAVMAGMDHARGEVVVLTDADLQNDPADIPLLLAKIDEGYDVVSGWRRERKDKLLARRVPSIIANWLISWVTNVHLHDYGCTLKAYRCEIASEIRLYGEMHRFIPVYAAAAGAKIGEIVVHHRPRIHGVSKYNLMKTGKVLLDLVTVKFLLSFRFSPMYLFGGSGLVLIGLGVLSILAALLNKAIRGISLIQTPLPTLAAMFAMMGVQAILMGLTTELLVRTYHESVNRPTYVIRHILNDHKHE